MGVPDVGLRITGSKIFRKQKIWKIYFTGKKNPKTRAYRSTKIDESSENSTEQNDPQKIYANMAHMSSNTEIPRRDF